jgi:hypothetical protein
MKKSREWTSKKLTHFYACAVLIWLSFGVTPLANAAIFSVGDLITTATQFNGFEGLPPGTLLIPPPSSYTEDGISVNQIDQALPTPWSSYNQIAVTYNPPGFFGSYSWYANGGDVGYTDITEQNGSAFNAVSILTGFGNSNQGGSYLNYELLMNGAVVLSGSVMQLSGTASPVTFYGGGFDQIFLSATQGAPAKIGSGVYQALAIDNIKVGSVSAIPEPGTLAMLLAGLGLLGFAARCKQDNAAKKSMGDPIYLG